MCLSHIVYGSVCRIVRRGTYYGCMQQVFPRAAVPNPVAVLRKAGYSPFVDPVTKEDSFVLRLGPDFYPRFHLYVQQRDDEVTLNLHLDQKQPSYGQGNKHGGEYDSPVVTREMRRIESWVSAYLREQRHIEPQKKAKYASWLSWFTGE